MAEKTVDFAVRATEKFSAVYADGRGDVLEIMDIFKASRVPLRL